MDDIRDYGIAVADATRLNDCFHELSEAFAARPAIDGDEPHYFSRAIASPGNEEWVHVNNSRNVAEITIKRAILNRSLPLWIRLADREDLTDINAIAKINHRSFATGTFLTDNYPKSNLEGRPLWIKHDDWQRFQMETMTERYGQVEMLGVSLCKSENEEWISFNTAVMRLAPVAGGSEYARKIIYGLLMARMSPYVDAREPNITWDEVPRKYTSPPPSHPHLNGKVPASSEWFNLAQQIENNFAERVEWPQFMHDYNKWLLTDDCLLVDWQYIVTKEIADFGVVPDAMLMDSNIAPLWSFPACLAWVASRSQECVARLNGHYLSAVSDANNPDADETRSLSYGWEATARSKIVGWLAYEVAEKCTNCPHREGVPRWVTCTCLSTAYDQLHHYALKGGYNRNTIPELEIQHSSGTFDLSWPPQATQVKFSRSEVLDKWPAPETEHSPIRHNPARSGNVQIHLAISRHTWSISDAITWHFDRNVGRLNDPAFCIPSLKAAQLYPDMSDGHRWIDSAAAVIEAMKAGEIVAERLDADGVTAPVGAGFWNHINARDLDKEQYANVVVPAASVRSAFPAPESTARDTTVQLFRLWSDEAKRSYDAERDRVCDEFSLAGRSQSASHVRRLSEAADQCVAAMLTKARALPIPTENYDVALEHALALFDELAADVRSVAIGANGRMPTPSNGAVADSCSAEGRARIEAKVAEWRLENELKPLPPTPQTESGHSQRSVLLETVKRRGRKPGSGSMAKADAPLLIEMRQLIHDGKAFSPGGAAKLVAAKAAGASEESNATRLAKRFRASEPNSSV